MDWWCQSLLFYECDQLKNTYKVEKIGQLVEESIHDNVSALDGIPRDSPRNSTVKLGNGYRWIKSVFAEDGTKIEQIDELERNALKTPSLRRRRCEVGKSLPTPFEEFVVKEPDHCECLVPGIVDIKDEIKVYRVFILAHLKGPNDPVFQEGIWRLARKCAHLKLLHGQEDWAGIRWLWVQGLHVPRILFNYHRQKEKSK